MLCGRSWSQKTICSIILGNEMLRIGKCIEKGKSVAAWRREGSGGE
jgi:hypothetical protein